MRLGGFLLVVLVVAAAGFASAAGSSVHSATKSPYVVSRFRLDLSGTNTLNWTLTPGTSCDAHGSGSQTIRVTSAGPASDRTIKLGISFYHGKVADVTVWLPYADTYFRVAQHDDRQGMITASGMSCDGLLDGPEGGPGSLCGQRSSKGIQGLNFRPDINVAKDQYVIRNGGLELGFTVNVAGGKGTSGVTPPYYDDPNGVLTDCPAAGDVWLGYYVDASGFETDPANDFLLYKHDSADDIFNDIPSYAPFSVKRLESCKAKTITAQTTAHDSASGPFGSWGVDDPPPAGWAHWQSSTTMHWKMTLHRLRGCKRIVS